MSLISILLVLVVIGIVLKLINSFIPMASSIKTILNLVVVIFVVYWLLSIFGLVPAVNNFFRGLSNIVTQQAVVTAPVAAPLSTPVNENTAVKQQ